MNPLFIQQLRLINIYLNNREDMDLCSEFKQPSSDPLWDSLLSSFADQTKKEKKTHLYDSNQNQNKSEGSKKQGEHFSLNSQTPPDWFNSDDLIDFEFEKKSDIQFLGQLSNQEHQINNRQLQTPILQSNQITPYLNDSIINETSTLKIGKKHLLIQKALKKQWKKNTNVPKYIVRVYLKHFNKYNREKHSKFITDYKNVKEELRERKTNNYNISDILKLYHFPEVSNEQVFLNCRMTMSQILQQTIKEEILQNPFISKNKISYMIAVKLYRIRCRSRNLIDRVKVF